jgi:hypothetical protein
MAMGSTRSPRKEEHWDIMIKVRGPAQGEELKDLINDLEGQEILDLRETADYDDQSL